jgi:hypothetical protein
MNNGTNGEVITPEDFDAMTDASDKPARAARVSASARGRARATGDAPVATTDTTQPVNTPEQAQAAREDIYGRTNVPEPLKLVFNRLPPEEIVFVLAHVENAYRSGLAAGASDGTCGHGAAMTTYNDVIAQLLEAVSLLDQRNPDVEGCLRIADAAHKRLTRP